MEKALAMGPTEFVVGVRKLFGNTPNVQSLSNWFKDPSVPADAKLTSARRLVTAMAHATGKSKAEREKDLRAARQLLAAYTTWHARHATLHFAAPKAHKAAAWKTLPDNVVRFGVMPSLNNQALFSAARAFPRNSPFMTTMSAIAADRKKEFEDMLQMAAYATKHHAQWRRVLRYVQDHARGKYTENTREVQAYATVTKELMGLATNDELGVKAFDMPLSVQGRHYKVLVKYENVSVCSAPRWGAIVVCGPIGGRLYGVSSKQLAPMVRKAYKSMPDAEWSFLNGPAGREAAA